MVCPAATEFEVEKNELGGCRTGGSAGCLKVVVAAVILDAEVGLSTEGMFLAVVAGRHSGPASVRMAYLD